MCVGILDSSIDDFVSEYFVEQDQICCVAGGLISASSYVFEVTNVFEPEKSHWREQFN